MGGPRTDRGEDPVTMANRTDDTNDSATGVFVEPAPAFSSESLREVLREHWNLTDPQLRPLDAERDLNLLVDGRLVLKIANPAEHPDVVDMEVRAREHVRASDPSLPVPASVATRAGTLIAELRDDTGRSCLARLITFLPGAALEGKALDLGLAEQVGAVAGRMSVALQGFFHPAAGRTLMWDIRRMPDVVAASGLADGRWRDLAARVAPALEATGVLPSGVQHADVTLTNVLADSGAVSAVIDFGDMHHTAAVCDLAVTLTSVLRGTAGDDLEEVWRLTDAVLRGYQRHRTLSPAEASVLGDLVIARLLTTLAVSSARRGRHSDNYHYITQYDRNSEHVLGLLSTLGPEELTDRMRRLAGTRQAGEYARDLGLPGRRAASMGGPLSPLFYREPLELVRGEGPWLYAADGTRYLDAYNNVAVVGHAHPAVTNAVSGQLATLNTHSRYLHSGIVGLAERILETMPAELDTCLFTTSGTEANELAWRLATEYTSGDAAVVAEHAFHGSSKWMADLSSNEWPEGYRPDRVATFEAAHGPAAGPTGALAVGRVERAAATLRASGARPALVLADSQFTSEGILDVPAGFLAGLLDGAHAVGALYLADEVQSGYGRSGPRLWRFAHAGITPDIVTLGKPMGAGYPIGAVVTRREIADVLAGRYEYFSTFAATPAAAAAGHAVLDVLQLTGLPARAVEVGARLRERLRTLAADEPLLGEVRGTGLLAGIDVAPRGGATSRATVLSLLESLVGRGVLAGLTGPRGDVLKIRPPLVWEAAQVDLFTDRLHRALGDLRA
jgi:4-aminobutyrate aminotransferase-like enzyme/Ser/Thr protein kinase RdoA (MazF antagonist)